MALMLAFLGVCILGTIEVIAKRDTMIEARRKAEQAFRR